MTKLMSTLNGYEIADAKLRARSDTTTTIPQMFGAIGDGVADDTEALQKTLNSGSAVIYIPPGTYNVTSALTVPTTVKRIYGAGISSSILNCSGDCFVIAEKVYRLTFSDFSLFGTNRTGTAFSGATAYSHFYDIVIQDFNKGFDFTYGTWAVNFDCITISYTNNAIVGGDAFNAFYAKGCAFNTCTTVFTCAGGQSIEFDKCTIEWCNTVFRLPQVRGFCVQNSYFEGNGNIFYVMRPHYDGTYTIRNCYIYQNKTGNPGWLCLEETSSSSDVIISTLFVENCRLHGNTDGLTYKPFAFTNSGTYSMLAICLEGNACDTRPQTYFDLFDLTNCPIYGDRVNNPLPITSDLPYYKQDKLTWYIASNGQALATIGSACKFTVIGNYEVTSTGETLISIPIPKIVGQKALGRDLNGAIVSYNDGTNSVHFCNVEPEYLHIYRVDATKTATRVFLNLTY